MPVLIFGAVFVVAAITLAEGASRLTVSETTLVSSVETPLAIIWAYLLFFEVPSMETIVGGVLVLLAVFGFQTGSRK